MRSGLDLRSRNARELETEKETEVKFPSSAEKASCRGCGLILKSMKFRAPVSLVRVKSRTT